MADIVGWCKLAKILPKLVELANVREHPDDCRSFCESVHNLLLKDSGWVYRLFGGRSKNIRNFEKAIRVAKDAAATIDAKEMALLGGALAESPFFRGEWERWPTMLNALVVACSKITGNSPHYEQQRRRGPKRGRQKNWPFQKSVRDLWCLARIHGGDFTLWSDDDGAAKGSLIEAIRLLGPFLGSDRERTMSFSTLNRIRKLGLGLLR